MKKKVTLKGALMAMMAAVLAYVFVLGSQMERVKAEPSGSGEGIILGSSGLSVGCNTADAATVYFGEKTKRSGETATKTPVPWRVIGYNGTGVASSSGASSSSGESSGSGESSVSGGVLRPCFWESFYLI